MRPKTDFSTEKRGRQRRFALHGQGASRLAWMAMAGLAWLASGGCRQLAGPTQLSTVPAAPPSLAVVDHDRMTTAVATTHPSDSLPAPAATIAPRVPAISGAPATTHPRLDPFGDMVLPSSSLSSTAPPASGAEIGVYRPGDMTIYRGQSPSGYPVPGVSGDGTVQPVQFTAPGPSNPFLPPPPSAGILPGMTDPAGLLSNAPSVPLNVNVAETRTGRFMFGAGVNSDFGVTGQISIDERNFDIWRPPTSWDDLWSGRAWRGGGQALRIEAVPGSQVQRYMISLSEPYLYDTNVSLNLSGYFFDRRYDDWDEQRLGGRVALGYRLTPDLSASAALRMENVNIHDPSLLIPQLVDVLGDNSLFSGRFTLAHDTRDMPFFPTEGHYIELAYEQVFGTFSYPRFEAELRKYFLMHERPDGSGRHTLAYSFRLGISGEETPIFENYFAGGFSTMRGFDYRGASPVDSGVQVGGRFRFLGSAEYLFPLTASDAVKGVLFVDYGTVEETVSIKSDAFRVAPGFGLRIAIPALGPAPLALDLAFPVSHENTDDIQNFSFYFGAGRS
ncbi:MAG: BamA/TamA family outer membrane protein [Planctomycetales bacterium]|nr:BamA/TamA family outer membrane protein [Planctomycetales bacterium]